ncbi:hypothetical protein A1F94_001026 [Pyrenophora tritici-repentis]|uniref:Uncharacterized protein n=1 Tax=Pyrenophora tritici-repentis TaxID=45151 RepID=A0A2W1GVS5_9PLEO|nr:hypothetical protein PtrV1_01651 [Pyrenophora tritici-repentis]KAF7454385.1 hypothetical protein A1F99_016430 [Pyrenophora tritici-repentis]KAF7577503.1 hypothetical protein PtrM4_017430 [Pyrenophora tritici-repentis]KAG9388134.1 hypothetical protein A1F94_001026 [Pyrenophora tritici-repentis]KAI0576460.1 hypothetical protein Alg215_07458 [Pyrenophora tritici-repentis]
MVIQWNNAQITERLFIAMLASVDNKINISEVARLYGEDMTYNALENRLRAWKKEATAMKAAASGREIAVKSPSKSRAKKGEANPTKKGEYHCVQTSRVTKARSKTNTPTKVKAVPIIIVDDEDELEEYAEVGDDDEEDFV